MSAHTVGPWVSAEVDYGHMVRISSSPSNDVRFIVADVVVPDNARRGRSERPRFLDDVAIMTAAPELLEACKAARALTPDGTYTASVLDAAIAKAEGRTP